MSGECPVCGEPEPDWPIEVRSEFTGKLTEFCTNCAKNVAEALFQNRTVTTRLCEGLITMEVAP